MGVDYARPILLKSGYTRKPTISKADIMVFISGSSGLKQGKILHPKISLFLINLIVDPFFVFSLNFRPEYPKIVKIYPVN